MRLLRRGGDKNKDFIANLAQVISIPFASLLVFPPNITS